MENSEKNKDKTLNEKYTEKLEEIFENLLDFMKQAAPVILNINDSITDSTNKIPKATNQINNVTNATEVATTEILDTVDIISNDVLCIEKNLDEISLVEQQKNGILIKMKSLHLSEESINMLNEYERINNTLSVYKKVYELTDKIKNNTNNIALSLQVQDITSQQLAAVNHLISSVQNKLSSLVQNLDDTNSKDFWNMEIQVPKGSHFDPNASYSRSDKRQENVDSIMNDQTKKTSQAEIDKLFL